MLMRLQEEEGGVEKNMHEGLKLYHRNVDKLATVYEHVMRTFNADQPILDLSNESKWCTTECNSTRAGCIACLVFDIWEGQEWVSDHGRTHKYCSQTPAPVPLGEGLSIVL